MFSALTGVAISAEHISQGDEMTLDVKRASGMTMVELLPELVDRTKKLINCDRASIFLLSEDKQASLSKFLIGGSAGVENLSLSMFSHRLTTIHKLIRMNRTDPSESLTGAHDDTRAEHAADLDPGGHQLHRWRRRRAGTCLIRKVVPNEARLTRARRAGYSTQSAPRGGPSRFQPRGAPPSLPAVA